MKVLSLFDGISCGMVALMRGGHSVERYVAYEIDKYAIQVSHKNYPQIEHCGDVMDADFSQYKGFDLLIGGSPCTYWSIAKNGRETTPDGIGGQLFMQYVRALKESGCRWFLYENNFSIHKNIKDFISEQLGVQPIMINSSLVSAQNRKRCYWTNIPFIGMPGDRGILVKDILESGYHVGTVQGGKNGTVTATYYKRGENPFCDYGSEQHCGRVAEPVMKVPEATKKGYCDIGLGECVDLAQPNSKTRRGRKMCEKTNAVTCSPQFYEYVGSSQPVRVGQYGNGGQGQRIYSVCGKSVTLSANGGGMGAKTGLYRLDLPDGEYIIRKLTPVECERLQTLPDGYTDGVSNAQRYKGIGNGWTVDVIVHLLEGLKKESD